MPRNISTDELASMIQNDVVAKMATKDDVARIDQRLEKIDVRLDRIENLLLRDHLNRIEKLEDTMRQVKTKLGVG